MGAIRSARSRCAGPTLSPCPVRPGAGAGTKTVIGDSCSSSAFGILERRRSARAPVGHEGGEALDHSPLFPSLSPSPAHLAWERGVWLPGWAASPALARWEASSFR